MKDQKGITLIALVITIIVLLILAGVSIAMLTGDNGILTKAGNASSTSADKEFEESVKLVVAEIVLNNKTGADEQNEVNKATMEALMPNINDNIKDFTVTAESTYFIAKGKIGGKEYQRYVTSAGKISTEVPGA